MKLRQRIKKKKKEQSKAKEQKRLMLLDDALKKLVELNIAIIDENKYKHSALFARTASEIIACPPSKFKQMKYGQEAGRKLILELLTLATTKPSRRDIENMITAYVCLKIHIDKNSLTIDKKILPDLTYAVWYLNDHEPTIEEVEEWTLQK